VTMTVTTIIPARISRRCSFEIRIMAFCIY
jgi:hypothetical protein